ncbi:MAG: hypothetical protein JWO44_1723 [Bacteroidetes bacterium]|nr:hypothetical protein [Bacteroidota bacterium]
MKKQLQTTFLSLLFMCFTINSYSQWSYTQYFDGADSSYYNSLFVHIDPTAGNIWQVGKPQKIVFDSAGTAPNAIVTDTINNYPVNNTSTFYFNVVPFMTHGILGIQWQQKLDMDKKTDGGIVEFSIDYGATWQNAFNNPHVYNFFGYDPQNQDTLSTGEYAFSGTDSTWRDVWLCYDMSWMSTVVDSIKVRFTFKSDSVNNNREGWMIDNMNAHVTIIHPVKEVGSADYFNIYPNPAKNIINIQLKDTHEYHIIEHMELYNSAGKLMQEWKNIPVRYWFSTENFPSGVYYLKIKTNLRSKTVAVTIMK